MLQQTQVDRVLPKYAEWLDEVPVARRARRRAGAGCHGDVVSARLQHPAEAAAVDRARVGRALRRPAAADEATLLSFKGIGAYTAGAIRSFAFRERAAILDTNVARVLFRVFVGTGDPKSHAMKRHLWTVSETLVPHAPRLRLQPGADGLRRDGLRRAQSEVPRLPDGEGLPRLSVHARPMTRPPIVVVTAAVVERDGRFLVTRREGRAPRRLLGISRRQVRARRSACTRASRASCARSSTSTSRRRRDLHHQHAYPDRRRRAALLPLRAARRAAAAARTGDALGGARGAWRAAVSAGRRRADPDADAVETMTVAHRFSAATAAA